LLLLLLVVASAPGQQLSEESVHPWALTLGHGHLIIVVVTAAPSAAAPGGATPASASTGVRHAHRLSSPLRGLNPALPLHILSLLSPNLVQLSLFRLKPRLDLHRHLTF